MMNVRSFVLVVGSIALTASTLLGQLKIDFNTEVGTRAIQAGYTEIIGLSGVATNDFGVDGTVTVALTGNMSDRDRGALTGGPGVAQSDLLRDFVFRYAGTGLGITLSTLKAGEYTFTGFFHDNNVQQGNGTLGVDTRDGQGEILKVTNFVYSTGFAPSKIGTASLSFTADGSESVSVYLRGAVSVDDQPYCINGFTLEKTVYPKGPDELVAYYDFEDSFSDSSGNDNHGIPNGAGVTFSTNTPSALSYSTKTGAFDGTNYVTLPYLGLYSQLAATAGLTISLWLKSESATPQTWFISEGCSTNELPAYVFGHSVDLTRPTALIRNLDGDLPLNKKTENTQLFNGSWHHWVWTDINGTANMYIDGNPVTAESGNWNYTHSDIPFGTTTLGAWFRNQYNTSRYPLLGQMDDVSIWNTILTENQIKYLAAGGDPLELGKNGVIIMVK